MDVLLNNQGLIYAGSAIFLVVLSFGAGWFSRSRAEQKGTWAGGWLQGFSTEMAGALVTTVLLTVVFSVSQSNEANQQRLLHERDQLIFRMGSPINNIAAEAVRQLRALDWLEPEKDTLMNRYFEGANLNDVDLSNVNLTNAIFANVEMNGINFSDSDLTSVNFQNINLTDVNFTGANLTHVDFLETDDIRDAIWINADLTNANFEGRNLVGINFSGTILDGTDFRGANLTDAVFTGANLENALLDEATRLPDGELYTLDADLTVFLG